MTEYFTSARRKSRRKNSAGCKVNCLKKITAIIVSATALLSFASCSGLKVTEQMQSGIDAYIGAVSMAESKTAGKVKVTSVTDDSAIEFKRTESVIEFDYTVEDGKVVYTRSDFIDGVKAAEYSCDGQQVMCRENGGDWADKTEESKDFLSPQTNPLTTLSLFRVDSKKRVRTEYMTDIKYDPAPDKDGYTSVEFTLKDSTVSDILGYNKVRGIVRNSAGHVRTYYIDSSGCIAKIVISTVQQVLNNGKEGYYTTEMTVLCS